MITSINGRWVSLYRVPNINKTEIANWTTIANVMILERYPKFHAFERIVCIWDTVLELKRSPNGAKMN